MATTTIPVSPLLRRVLQVDALASGASGLLMLAGAGALEGPLGLPVPLLRFAGLALLPWAVLVGWLSVRATLSRRAVWAVIICNLLWAADCVLLLAGGFVSPTGLGIAFVLVQAAVVAVLADLQWLGLRRAVPQPA
jgi:hypothetical protein